MRELLESKTPKVLASLPERGEGWTVYYAFFSRAGFTPTAQREAAVHKVTLVDLARLEEGLVSGA